MTRSDSSAQLNRPYHGFQRHLDGYAKQSKIQGLTVTLTCSPLESKIGSVESEKCQLTKNTCPIRKVIFYSQESSFWCSNRLLEN